MNDEKELHAMMYIGALLVQVLGNSMRGNALTKGHLNDMHEGAVAVADRAVKAVAEMNPKKGK